MSTRLADSGNESKVFWHHLSERMSCLGRIKVCETKKSKHLKTCWFWRMCLILSLHSWMHVSMDETRCKKSNVNKKGKNFLFLFDFYFLLFPPFHICNLRRRCRSYFFPYSFFMSKLKENECGEIFLRAARDEICKNNPKVRLECVSKSKTLRKMKSFIFPFFLSTIFDCQKRIGIG